jgi:hypothetical protein
VCNRSVLVLTMTQVQVCLAPENTRITIQSCANNKPSTIAQKVTYYKRVEVRKVRDPLLTVSYITIYVYNLSVFSARRSYGLSDNVLGFMFVAPSSYIASRDFTSFGS